MLIANLCPGKMEVVVNHFQGGMAEDFLKGEDISAVEQIVNSECMPAQMSMKTCYSGLLGQSREHKFKGIGSYGITAFGLEKIVAPLAI